MEHGETIKTAAMMIAKRRETYGSPKDGFDRAAMLASTILDKPITPYEVSIIMHAVKLSRIAQSPTNPDHYIDGIAYLAFASEFVDQHKPDGDTL